MADPDQDVLTSTALLVSSLGFEPVSVGQPDDVLAQVETHRPGLVLVETQFPGLNLAGFLAALRSQPETAAIPVAFLSASKDLAATAARHQVWGTLAKPFSLRELGMVLTRALGPSRAMLEEGAQRSIEREVRAAFHDYRNVLTAVTNYLAVLEASELPPQARMAADRLVELATRLEGRTEHLRAYVLSLVLPYALADIAPTRGQAARLPPRQGT